MSFLDYVIIGGIAVWFAAALRSIIRKKGGCCCSCSSCKGCKKEEESR